MTLNPALPKPTAINPDDVPRGILIYLSRAAREWDPAKEQQQARKAQRAGISHVALCAEAKDGWVAKHDVLRDLAKCYAELAGVKSSVYSLPGGQAVFTPERTVARLLEAGEAIGAHSVIGDFEEEFNRQGRMLKRARVALIDGASERRSVGFTNYGVPGQKSVYPWESIAGWGWFGWQCYETSADEELVRKRLDLLRKIWSPGSVIPHFATYERRQDPNREGKDGALRLARDLERACLNDDGVCDVPGIGIWQDSTMDGEEAAVLKEWSERLRGAVIAPAA